MRAATAALILSLATPAVASDLRLEFPVDCVLDQTCYIQRYMDHDPGPGLLDYRCGDQTGEDHSGTDIALHTLVDMRKGIAVRAAAPGVVVGIRDGMADQYYLPSDAARIKGRECGNGVVLAHDDGWETQYCHLKSGSVAVAKGDRIATGDRLGHVGLSGLSSFPHLHLSVRRDGKRVDPFRPEATSECGAPDMSLWTDPPAYKPGGLIYVGFSDHLPGLQEVSAGSATEGRIDANADALVLFALGYGGQVGDMVRLSIDGPKGRVVATDMTLEKPKVRYFRATGKRLTLPTWPSGSYSGTVILLRDDLELDQRQVHLTIP